MPRTIRKILSALLCLLLILMLPLLAFAEDIAQEFTPGELSPEELAQWEEWALAEAEAEKEAATAGNAEELSPEDEAAMAELAAALDNHTPSEEVDLSNLEINEALPNHIVNILLLGVDNRSVELERGLSDAVIICSINTENGSVRLTSIARDTAVIVPGYKPERRINVAYRYGGPELSMKTINRNFHMNIHSYVVVNIHGLADIIDTLGGIDMQMTSKEAGRINYELRKEPMDKVKREKVPSVDGVQHLDGMQAVTFARIRGIDNDLERTRRQRQLLETLLSAVMKDMNLGKFVTLIETALPYGETNLSVEELLQLGMAVLGGEAMSNLQSGQPVLEQMRIPIDKKYGYRDFNGNSLIYLSKKNLAHTITTLQEFIYGESFE